MLSDARMASNLVVIPGPSQGNAIAWQTAGRYRRSADDRACLEAGGRNRGSGRFWSARREQDLPMRSAAGGDAISTDPTSPPEPTASPRRCPCAIRKGNFAMSSTSRAIFRQSSPSVQRCLGGLVTNRSIFRPSPPRSRSGRSRQSQYRQGDRPAWAMREAAYARDFVRARAMAKSRPIGIISAFMPSSARR